MKIFDNCQKLTDEQIWLRQRQRESAQGDLLKRYLCGKIDLSDMLRTKTALPNGLKRLADTILRVR